MRGQRFTLVDVQVLVLNKTAIMCILYWTRSNVKQWLATFASGRLCYLLKIGQPFKNNLV